MFALLSTLYFHWKYAKGLKRPMFGLSTVTYFPLSPSESTKGKRELFEKVRENSSFLPPRKKPSKKEFAIIVSNDSIIR